jgi:mannose/cellobiose epimerase-like protein (N-acyl-D-glucosamine 2-epimerase family)
VSRDARGMLASEMEEELRKDILPFWPRFIDQENGGFYRQVDNEGPPDLRTDKGPVMHARPLWTCAAARLLDSPALLLNTPQDRGRSRTGVEDRLRLIRKNRGIQA